VIGAGVIDASGIRAAPRCSSAVTRTREPERPERATDLDRTGRNHPRDAGTTGDGGRVIVWSDDYTRFSARFPRAAAPLGQRRLRRDFGRGVNALAAWTRARRTAREHLVAHPDVIEMLRPPTAYSVPATGNWLWNPV